MPSITQIIRTLKATVSRPRRKGTVDRGVDPVGAVDRLARTLFEPVGLARFIREYWPDRSCRVEGSPGRFDSLGVPRDPLELIHLAGSDVIVTFLDREGSPLGISASPDQAAFLYRGGHGMALLDMQERIHELGLLATSLERALGVPQGSVVCNVFVSPPAHGLTLHFDHREVITLQLSGCKRWQVSKEPAVRFPTINYVAGTPVPKALEPYAEGVFVDPDAVPEGMESFTLTPGDVAFMPRGHWHLTQAEPERAQGSISIGLTFATPTWADVVTEHLRQALLTHEPWRCPVSGFGGPEHSTTPEARIRLRELLEQLPQVLGALTPEQILPAEGPEASTVDALRSHGRRNFCPDAAQGVQATYQLCLTGPGEHDLHFRVRDGALTIGDGRVDEPTVTVTGTGRDLLRMLEDPGGRSMQLLLDGRVRVRPLELSRLTTFMAVFSYS